MKFLERLRDHERAGDGIRSLQITHPADAKERVRDLEVQERDAIDLRRRRVKGGYVELDEDGDGPAACDASIKDSPDMIVVKLGGKLEG